MNTEQILKAAKPRPWTEESLRAACNLALTGKARINQNDLRLIVLAVNSYEAREALAEKLEATLTEIYNCGSIREAEILAQSGLSALAAAKKVQP
jgi:hypothetical protein